MMLVWIQIIKYFIDPIGKLNFKFYRVIVDGEKEFSKVESKKYFWPQVSSNQLDLL